MSAVTKNAPNKITQQKQPLFISAFLTRPPSSSHLFANQMFSRRIRVTIFYLATSNWPRRLSHIVGHTLRLPSLHEPGQHIVQRCFSPW